MNIFILEKKKAKISCNDELAALKKGIILEDRPDGTTRIRW